MLHGAPQAGTLGPITAEWSPGSQRTASRCAAPGTRDPNDQSFRTLDDVDVTGKRVLVRVDLNVPMEDGGVTDDTRLSASLPTIAELAGKGGKVILLAHFDRPKGRVPKDVAEAGRRGAVASCSAAGRLRRRLRRRAGGQGRSPR